MSLRSGVQVGDSSDEESEDNSTVRDNHLQGQEDGVQSGQSSETSLAGREASSRPSAATIHKRRRVTRACDECRRKKIKCDGKHPCTHCTVYTYDCTYDQPSNRRRNPAPQYVEALENKLRRAEMLLKNYVPEVDLDDPSLDASISLQDPSFQKQNTLQVSTGRSGRWNNATTTGQSDDEDKDSMLESMVENTGSLVLDDDGNWDFYGHSSGRVFLGKMREQFGSLMGNTEATSYALPRHKKKPGSQPISSPTSSVHSPLESRMPSTYDLPSKSCARLLCRNALDDACAVIRFIHQPSFYTMFDRVYDLPPESLSNEDLKFLPLLYAVIAVGALFATAEQSELMTNGLENAIQQGSHWYKTARSMTDVTDCRDLTSLQTMLFMIMFLQSSAELSSCYTYIGICLRCALRLGLHRAVTNAFNPVEQELRKRVFWCIRKMDVYVGVLLGLPKMLSDIDIDQDQPVEVDDDFITIEKILPMPPGQTSLIAGFNAHNRLVAILSKVVEYVYPIKTEKRSKNQTYIVNHAKIREVENALNEWTETLPEPFKPGCDGPREYVRIQHILRMAYAHIQMFLYRPFLHYASLDMTSKSLDKTSFACAAACVSVSRNIVHLTGEMKRRELLGGSYWFYNYTTFFAIIGLVFFILENPHSATSAEVLRDAYEGKDTLSRLASKSLAADRCTKYLSDLFDQLSDKLKEVQMNAVSQRKRQKPSQTQLPSHIAKHTVPPVSTGNFSRPINASPPLQSPWQHQSFPLLDSNVDTSYQNEAQTPYPNSAPPQTPRGPGSAIYTNMTTRPGVTGFSAMMFPSADPFAYPNQPLTTLDHQQHIKQEDSTQQQAYSAHSTRDMDAAIYGTIPDYGMMSPGGQGGFGMPLQGASQTQNSPAFPPAVHAWPPHQQQAENMQYGHLYGEDWGGWMQQGPR